MLAAFKKNWQLYLIEAWGLGVFMISACFFATILEYPHSTVRIAVPQPFVRLVLMGMAMGLTAAGILYSPWGKRSGAHINPAVTVTFLFLKKIEPYDALWYMIFQTLGGTLAVYLMQFLLGNPLKDKPVQSVVTIPYCGSPALAFFIELAISFTLMSVVLKLSDSRFAKYTWAVAGFLVMIFVIIAGPVSGFGMNPARSFASALPANVWDSVWIYLLVPPAGMLLAAKVYASLTPPEKPTAHGMTGKQRKLP